MYAITGATGQLGRLAIASLAKKVDPKTIVALVRDEAKAADLKPLGVNIRKFDYTKPETLEPGLKAVEKLLLISSSEIGQRAKQHKAVIDAAKKAGVKFIAYTSLLHADKSKLDFAVEHRATEADLKASGLPHAVLRNSWYNENFAGVVKPGVQFGAVLGSSGKGRFSAATRADYAEAAVAVLTAKDDQSGKVYELGGDEAFSKAELAAEIAKQSGKPVAYKDLPEADYAKALEGVGLPAPYATILAQSDVAAASEDLFDGSKTLSKLIGRKTTSIKDTVAAALKA